MNIRAIQNDGKRFDYFIACRKFVSNVETSIIPAAFPYIFLHETEDESGCGHDY